MALALLVGNAGSGDYGGAYRSAYADGGRSKPEHRTLDGAHAVDLRIDPVFVANDPSGLRFATLDGEGLMLAHDIMVERYAEAGAVLAWSAPDFERMPYFRADGSSRRGSRVCRFPHRFLQ